MAYEEHVRTDRTPQTEPIPGTMQVTNSASGYSWAVDSWMRLDRFLILGTEGGSYYATERKLTQETAAAVLECLTADAVRTLDRIAAISDSGRAPKNDPAIFALALCAARGDLEARRLAFDRLSRVCRIGTHLFHFLRAYEALRAVGGQDSPTGAVYVGRYGRSVRRALSRWYLDQTAEELSYELIKYRQRDGWSHRDVVRLAHPKASGLMTAAALRWLVKGFAAVNKNGLEDPWTGPLPNRIMAFEALQTVTQPAEAARLIRAERLPREAVPAELLKHAEVWAALLEEMPLTGMIRNLATLTRLGVVGPLNADTEKVVAALADSSRLIRARVHPITILTAMRTYESGKSGEAGGTARIRHEWEPISQIVDALDRAFYAAFDGLEVRPERLVLALDVSGSMGDGAVAGVPNLTPREASAALALVFATQFPNHVMVAFSAGGADPWVPSHRRDIHGAGYRDGISMLDISPKQRLTDAVRVVSSLPFGGTDCALPMLWAQAKGVKADGFVILTDSETWAGSPHPAQALRDYRAALRVPAKLVVCGMVANGFTIADPNDAGMLDVVGFDTAAPQLIADFVGGGLKA